MKKSILIISLIILTISNNFSQSFRIRNDEFIQIGYDTYKALTFGIHNGTPNNGQWAIEHYDGGFNICKPWPSNYNGNYKLYIKDTNGNVGINCKPSARLQIDGLSEEILRARVNGATKFLLNSNGGVSIGTYNTSPPSNGLWVYGSIYANNGTLIGSDRKLKEDIKKLDKSSSLNKILELQGVSYRRKIDHYEMLTDSALEAKSELIKDRCGVSKLNASKRELGLIAQEVEQIIPEAVVTMEDGVKAIAYHNLTALLIEAIKELKSSSDMKSEIIADLENRITSLEELMLINENAETKSALVVDSQKALPNNEEVSALFQNSPNPFNEITNIQYFIADNVIEANLYIYDMQGTQKKGFKIENRRQGSVTIMGKELTPGMYMYSLIADGKEVATKKMILTD